MGKKKKNNKQYRINFKAEQRRVPINVNISVKKRNYCKKVLFDGYRAFGKKKEKELIRLEALFYDKHCGVCFFGAGGVWFK